MAHVIDNARFRGELRQAMADFQNKLAEWGNGGSGGSGGASGSQGS